MAALLIGKFLGKAERVGNERCRPLECSQLLPQLLDFGSPTILVEEFLIVPCFDVAKSLSHKADNDDCHCLQLSVTVTLGCCL